MTFLRVTKISLVLAFFLLAAAGPSHAGLFGDPGKKKIRHILRSPAIASANVGVSAIDAASGKNIFSENSGKLFIPASSAKLLTAYAAFKVLTPNYVFRTEFTADTLIDSCTVHNLYVKGYGDPSVTLADINLQALALSDKVARISGDINVDNTYFDGLQFGRGWMWDEGIVAWNAPIAPYAVNGNCVDIFVRPGEHAGDPAEAYARPATAYVTVVSSAMTGAGEIQISREEAPSGDRFIVTGFLPAGSPARKWQCTVSRPGLYAGTLFKELLVRYGVRVPGNVYERMSATGTVQMGSYTSRSLADIVRAFLKDSDNLTGECILKALGAARYGAPGTAEKGAAAIREVLRGRSIGDKTYTLVDGSGLSTYNLLTPDILTGVLRAAYEDFSFAPEFMDALAVAGRDGTMKHRLGDAACAGRMRAKTGTMSGVSCLAGYLEAKSGRIIAVAIMMNGFTGSADALRAVQDEIITTLWECY